MTTILQATSKDAALISTIAKTSFVESHGNSASTADINAYMQHYSEDAFKEELSNEKNIYHIIYAGEVAAGYSKIILDCAYSNASTKNIAKLERIYLLKEFYSL